MSVPEESANFHKIKMRPKNLDQIVPVLVPAAARGPMSSPLPGSSPRTPVRRRVVPAVRSPSPPPSSASPTHSEETVLTVTLLKRSVGVVVGRRLRAQSVYRRALATPLSAQMPGPGCTAPDGRQATPSPERPAPCRLPLRGVFENSFMSLVGAENDTAANARQLICGLELLMGVLSSDVYPSEAVLTHLLHHILMAQQPAASGDPANAEVRRRCLDLLHRVVMLHPPDTRHMRKVYHAALVGPHCSSWALVTAVVETCMEAISLPCEEAEKRVRTATLDFIVSLLESDMITWSNRMEEPWQRLSRGQAARPLVARAIWTGDYIGRTNANCETLLEWLITALCDGERGPDMSVCLPLLTLMRWRRGVLQRLVAMVAEVVRFSEKTWLIEVSDKMKAFAMELCRNIEEKDVQPDVLENILCLLRPAWLAAWVAAGLLEQRHHRRRPPSLALKEVAASYFSCVTAPQLGPQKENVANGAQQKVATAVETPPAPPKKRCWRSPAKGSPSKRRCSDLSRANPDGRTPLHEACAAGDAARVQQCLQTPGVRVNAQDVAGRTALHEAASLGHVQCVQLLLSYQPRNIHRYFSPVKAGSAGGRVDDRITSNAGVTAFHEALMNDRCSVVRVMKEELGPGMEQQVTRDGRLPAELTPPARRQLIAPEPASPAGPVRQLTLLLYHLLSGQLRHSGLVEVGALLQRQQRTGLPLPLRPAAEGRLLTSQVMDWYLRELRWLQGQRWPPAADRRRLHVRFGLYMVLATRF